MGESPKGANALANPLAPSSFRDASPSRNSKTLKRARSSPNRGSKSPVRSRSASPVRADQQSIPTDYTDVAVPSLVPEIRRLTAPFNPDEHPRRKRFRTELERAYLKIASEKH
ncbi:hypothetical protein HK104_001803 [Borealophlyctis nickersoniae]|nr:hypothetical protein HK104_001803 [Borealophlyctis nickersoniae]